MTEILKRLRMEYRLYQQLLQALLRALRQTWDNEKQARRGVRHVRQKHQRYSEQLEEAGYVYSYQGRRSGWLSPHTGRLLHVEDVIEELWQVNTHGAA